MHQNSDKKQHNSVGILDRYDRQLMIWGESGQEILSNSHVCVLHYKLDLMVVECLKSMVLMGIGKITLIGEFGLEKLALFDIEGLQSMNPHVQLDIQDHTGDDCNYEDIPGFRTPHFWAPFDAVIGISAGGPLLQCINELWLKWEHCLPTLILSYAFDAYGYVRLIGNEPSCVINSHAHSNPDLRLTCMWPELEKYHESFQFDKLSQHELSAVPYSVLLSTVSKELRKSKIALNRNSVKAALIRLHDKYMSGSFNDDVNFIEADRYSFLLFNESNPFPDNLTKILQTIHSEPKSIINKWVYHFVQSVEKFYTLNGCLPVRSAIPDMECSTLMFNEQKAIYARKSAQDVAGLMEILSPHSIPEYFVRYLLQNLRTLDVVKLSSITREDVKEQSARMTDLLIHQKDHLYAADPNPAISAILGSLTAQECVKLLTHQFVPLQNTLIYDGLSNTTEIISI